MVGLGETEEEVTRVLDDLRRHHCDLLTIGQYLSPSKGHFPVKAFIHPDAFDDYGRIALSMGFKAVASGPFVRSSYQAEALYRKALESLSQAAVPSEAEHRSEYANMGKNASSRLDELKRDGWTRQFVASEPRLSEAVALYEESGFEVHLESLSSGCEPGLLPLIHSGDGCTNCFEGFEDQYKIIFTRPGRDGPSLD
jgi:hypothetical protein